MSINQKKKPGAAIYLLPLAAALPIAAGAAFVLYRIWPSVHKMVSILIKLVVKA